MNDRQDLTPFLNSPHLLTQLCKDVIASLDEQQQSAELDEREKQLNEIARTIVKLEKKGISVPDELRQLKTGLVAKLGVRDEIINRLEKLTDGLEEVLQELHSKIGRSNSPHAKKPRRKKHSTKPKTSSEILRKEIIQALNCLGGKGRIQQVLAEMEKQLDGRLLPRDLETVSTGDLVWKNSACWERLKMVKDGILKSDSSHGIWELSKVYE